MENENFKDPGLKNEWKYPYKKPGISDEITTKGSKHFKHTVKVYVPCFQVNDEKGPHFSYAYADATEDEQMAWCRDPAYVLVLTGTFDAKTQPYDRSVAAYNTSYRDKVEDHG